MLQRLRRKRQRRQQADTLYSALVAQARNPEFYSALAVPDSFDGRFEMVVLHVYVLTRGVQGRGDALTELSRMVMESMIDDMDRTLREIGVGDMSVGRKVKQMAAAFYGRASAYDKGLQEGDEEIREAVVRNIYAGAAVEAAALDRMVAYLHAAVDAVGRTDDNRIEAGNIDFPNP